MGEISLTRLALEENIAALIRNQAVSDPLFLYREVLHQDLGPVDALRIKRPGDSRAMYAGLVILEHTPEAQRVSAVTREQLAERCRNGEEPGSSSSCPPHAG